MLLEFLDHTKTTQNENIIYGQHLTPFGHCLIALFTDKVCHLAFINENNNSQEVLTQFKKEWKNNKFIEDNISTKYFIDEIFYNTNKNRSPNLTILLKGTSFQFNIWKTLTEIPAGTTLTYSEIAAKIGKPKSFRTVATQIAKNQVMILIPCHRVIQKSGKLGGYRYGMDLKEKILKYEEQLD